MKKEISDELKTIFSRYETKLQTLEAAKVQESGRQRAFVNEFYQKRDLIIRPAMDAIGSYLEDHGHSFAISSLDEAYDAVKKEEIPARIQMEIIERADAANEKRSAAPPYFAAICSKSSRSVQFYENTLGSRRGGQAGITGDSRLSDLTIEDVQRRLVKLLSRIFQ